MLVAPLIKTSGDLVAQYTKNEKTQVLVQDAERALELIGRSIRMAGYQNGQSMNLVRKPTEPWLLLKKSDGFQGSDSLFIRHQLSSGIDFDCIGNVMNTDRTKQQLARHGYVLERMASSPKFARIDEGSLVCQSLDRQGRLQKTTLMSGVRQLRIEEVGNQASATRLGSPARLFTVKLTMGDGHAIERHVERTFATRNLL